MQDMVTNEGDTSRPLTNIDLSLTSATKMNATKDRIATSMWHYYTHNIHDIYHVIFYNYFI